MIKSMTGFGRGVCEKDGRSIIVELRCVNHKFFDPGFRMPRTFGFLEEHIRQLLQTRISRGHVDINITYTNTRTDAKSVTADTGIIGQYVDAATNIIAKYELKNDITALGLLRMPEVVTVTECEEDFDAIKEMTTVAVNAALDSVCAMREKEGLHLHDDLMKKLDILSGMRDKIEALSPMAVEIHKQKFTERINQFMPDGMEPDLQRLATEIAIYADKACIDEELVRIKTHIANMRVMLDSDEPVGRKADFLVQELNREFNTTGSKSQDTDIAALVIAGKAEIEKIREQIQNIE